MPPAQWPLVGRNEELGLVVEQLRRPDAAGVIIAGAAGVGKSRLAREAAGATGSDLAVDWAMATAASATIPFGAVAHLLPRRGPTEGDRLRLLQQAMTALVERAGDRRPVLAVDDAHLLDAGAAALVHQLVVGGVGRVLLTVRSGEPAPDAIAALWKDGFVERLELQPLARHEVEDLVERVVGGPVDLGTVRRLWQLSGGNPLFLRELLLDMVEAGALDHSEGVVQGAEDWRPSIRLSTILEERIGRVSRAGRAVLDHLALGEPLALDTLARLGAASDLDEVERAGLLVVDGEPPTARLAHPLYAEALRSTMTAVTRRAIAGRLADGLESEAAEAGAGGSPLVVLRVANLRLESGARSDPAQLVRAAEVANSLLDHVQAERLARRAALDGGGLRASLALGHALNHQGRCAEALEVLDPLVGDPSTDRDRIDLAVARLFGLTSAQGFRPEFEAVLLEAEESVTAPHLQAFLRAQRATLLVLAGQLAEGVALVTPGAPDAQEDEASRLRAVPALGGAWLCSGRSASAVSLAEGLIGPALARRDELPQAPGWVASTLIPALVASGRLDDADAMIGLAEAPLEQGPANPEAVSFVAFARGLVALYRGQPRTARRWFVESLPALRRVSRWRTPFGLAQLVEACALTGDRDGAEAAASEAEALLGGAAVFEGMVRRARGWLALARRQPSLAIDLLLDAAEWSCLHGQHTAELHALHDAVRFGAGARAAPRLVELAVVVEGRWATCFGAHAAAVLADDGQALEAVATELAEAGAMLLAGDAAAQAASAFGRAGLRSSAKRAGARAHQWRAACEDASTPALEDLDQPPGLTRREREIAVLAADGLSTRAIAEQLVVSIRTVEGHLYRLYPKLGVSDREGLAQLLGRGRTLR